MKELNRVGNNAEIIDDKKDAEIDCVDLINKNKENTNNEKIIVHLMVGFREICVVTAILPVAALLTCFITAYIFQPDEIHETHCRVYNIIPSISAITGVSPQRYIWRICVALHIGPRFAIAAVYRNHYRLLYTDLNETQKTNKINRLIDFVYWLNMIEIGSLCGVTYISNRENYPIHEKIFIVFMICSLIHMLATIKLTESLKLTNNYKNLNNSCNNNNSSNKNNNNNNMNNTNDDNNNDTLSLLLKKVLFLFSIISTIGLIIFFLKHRFLCHDMAFSWFALCEYIIAVSNMAFHCTTMLDFPFDHFIVAKGANRLKQQNVINWKMD